MKSRCETTPHANQHTTSGTTNTTRDVHIAWLVAWYVVHWLVGCLVGLLVGWSVGWLAGYIQIEGIDYTDIQADKRNAKRDLQTKETHQINTPDPTCTNTTRK